MKTFPIQLDDNLWAELKGLALYKRVSLKKLILDLLTKAAKEATE